MSKVYRIDDIDWVYAENEEQARKHYLMETQVSPFDIEKIDEVPLSDVMLVEISRIPEEERDSEAQIHYFAGERCVHMPFSWVIEREKITAPEMLATTEG